jgi:hypothetical protein
MSPIMHDQKFPESEESPERRTERAVEALEYEQSAGLGFRRRLTNAMGNPYASAEEHQVDREPSQGELWANLAAGVGLILGIAALFYKPLLVGFLAAVFIVLGTLGDSQGSKISRVALPVAATCFFFGMLLAIFVTEKAVW